MKQFFLLSIFVFVNTLFGQTNNSFFSGKRNLSFNINYDENGFFSEGYYHFNTTSNYFVEASINDFNLDKNRTSFFSTTIGSIRSISLNTTFGFGYTSYFDNELEYEHELFLGSRYNFFSGIIYFDAQQNLLSYQAIINANLGFSPMDNGEMLIINIPPLTEERRIELVKRSKSESENCKVVIRSSRKDANDEIKKLAKDGLPEDVAKDAEFSIQKLTDTYISQIESILKEKDAEIMKV
mgnify:CR=1 FL=1